MDTAELNRIAKPALLAAVVCGLMAVSARADVVVDWGGNYVGNADGTQPMQVGGFSGGDPLVISPSAPQYQPYSGALSATIRGQLTVSGSDYSFYQVLNNGGADQLQFKTQNGNSGAALALWASDEFIGSPNTAIEFDATSSIDLNVNTFVQVGDVRHVIRTASGYFISDTGTITGTGAQSSGNLTALNWYQYDPATSLTTIGSAASIVSGGKITGITEVGFLALLNSSGGNALRMDSYEVTANFIPEPASLALLGLGSLLITRRRHG
jgi:hypothetical protein